MMRECCAGLVIETSFVTHIAPNKPCEEKPLNNYLLWLLLIFATCNLFAVIKRWKQLEYFTKPAVILTLLVWLLSVGGYTGHMVWFMLGLIFSLAGDVLLLLPAERFISAWFTFLLTQLCYVLGFNPTLPPLNSATLLIAIIVGLVSFRLARIILVGLKSSGNSNLQIHISIYSLTISVMVLSALLTLVRPDWLEGPALMVSAGGILFFISDAVLALHRFVAPIQRSELLVMITYHGGQVLIITGSYLHYILLA